MSYTYNWDFSQGLGPWTSWLSPAVVEELGGPIESFTRLQAPGAVDPNHIDGVGALWLVAHLSTPVVGSPGALDLRGGEFEITIRATDFDANGAQLCLWLCSYIPEEQITRGYYVGLQATNWANTGGDFVDELGVEWKTIKVALSDDPADWTYAGNNVSQQGDWADRYGPLGLEETLSFTNATLHLVLIGDEPDEKPSGFLDVAGISVTTTTPAIPAPHSTDAIMYYALEDQSFSETLPIPDGADPLSLEFHVVSGSATNGSVSIDPDTGAFTFTPSANYYGPTDFNGAATFQYIVTQNGEASGPKLVQVFVGPINDGPASSAVDESVEIAANAPFAFSLLIGSDIDGDGLTFKLVSGSEVNGSVTIDPNSGRYVFTPTVGFHGSASFAYVINDGHVDSVAKLVEITVLEPGDPGYAPTFSEVIDDHLLIGDMDGFVHYTILLAQQGDPNASYHYGSWLGGGLWVAKDTALAAHYLGAAVGVVPDASLQLAMLYLSGDGVDKDYAAARALLEALPDNASAIYRLAVMDDLGLGGPEDDAAAAAGFLNASMMGSADAMYTLGRRYLLGEGVPESPVEAYFWLGVGLKFGGGPDLAAFTTLLAANMQTASSAFSADDRELLDDAIQDWIPGAPPPAERVVVVGSAADDVLTGQLAHDVLKGLDGNDRLIGGAVASNELYGGAGDDTYVVSSSGDDLIELEGEGIDTVETSLSSHTLQLNIENLTHVGAGPFAGVGNALNNLIAGNVGDDVLSGRDGADVLDGGDGVDILEGDDGDDSLTGGVGADVLNGGAGVDVASYRSSVSAVTASLNAGAGSAGDAQGDSYVGIESLTGSDFDDILVGDAGRNVLIGSHGDDYLIGLGGDDTLIDGFGANTLTGGLGNDLYIIRSLSDSVVEFAGEGTDQVQTFLASYILRDNVEDLVFVGNTIHTGYGTSVSNLMIGATNADTLYGLAGDDRLQGEDGDDVLVGGLGADQLNGGAGLDVASYLTSAVAVTASLGGGGSAGDAQGDSYVGIENLTGSNFNDILVGDGIRNTLIGERGDDYLIGLGGDDILIDGFGVNTLQGGIGNDIYAVQSLSDTVVEFASEGTDQVQTFLASYTLREHVEDLVFVGNTAHTGVGTTADNMFIGAGADDTFTGMGGHDRFVYSTAGGAADTITDFDATNGSANHDLIDLHGRVADFGALTITTDTAGSLITLGNGDSIHLLSVVNLDSGDFLF